jgi:predicted MFS family arabinose efflux permease
MPLSYALATSWHGPSQRLLVSSRLGVCSSIGTLLGQVISGMVGARFGWRAPFLVIGAAILTGAAVLLGQLPTTLPVPQTYPNQSNYGKQQKKRLSLSQRPSLFRNKTYWLLLLQGIPGCIPWAIFGTFLPDYLHTNVGYSVPEATMIGVWFNIGVLLGTLITGNVGQWLYNKSSEYPSILMVTAGLLRIPLVCHLFDRAPESLCVSCQLAFTAGLMSAPTGALVRPTLANVVFPNQQGVAFASFVLTDDLGRGAGPWLVNHLASGTRRRPLFGPCMHGYRMHFWEE